MDLVTKYIVALSNLYGLVSPKQVLEIYNSQNKQKISLVDLNDALEERSDVLKDQFVFIEHGLFVHEATYVERDTPHEIFKERSKWPYYIPKKEELLKYVDEYYFEKNDEFIEIEDFLTQNVTDGDTVSAEEIATEIHDHLTVNFNDLTGALEIITDFGHSLKGSETKGQLGLLIADYVITIRVWEQNGFSLAEMNDRLRESTLGARTSLEEHFEKASHLEKYIVSLTHLYGRVTKEKVIEVYNLQNQTPIRIDEVEKYLTDPPSLLEEVLVYVKFGEFVSEGLEMFEDVREELVEAQKGKPFYIPEQEELFNYFNYNYTNYPKEYYKLLNYLEENVYDGNHNQATRLAEYLQLILTMGDGVQGAIEHLIEEDFIYDYDDHLHEVTNLIKRLNNNTRMRDNNGLTPRELSRIEKERKVQRINIGRNDPCYCGSGKKYKKCCLKKDQV